MKIVIDIDDNTYTHLFDSGMEIVPQVGEILLAVKNGKPLPKGHGRLIDGDALLDKERDYGEGQYKLILIDPCFVKYAPTIIEADEEGAQE